MIEHLGLRWALTLVLVCVAALHVHRLGVRSSATDRIGEGAHGVMCAAMIVMAWPWGEAIPLWPQVALFGSGATWFTALGLLSLAAAYWWFGESVRILRASNSWQRGRCAVAHTAMGTATAVMVFAML